MLIYVSSCRVMEVLIINVLFPLSLEYIELGINI